MEQEILNTLSSEGNAVYYALIIGVLLLINAIFKALGSWVTKELSSKQQMRHDRLRVENDLEIEMKRDKLRREKEQALIDIENRSKRSTVKDVLEVSSLLRRPITYFYAARSTITLYHNGIAKNFRNFSIRYEEVRTDHDPVESALEHLQSKPLHHYYNLINRFHSEDYLIYNKDDEMTHENSKTIQDMRTQGYTKRIVLPLLISDNVQLSSEAKLVELKRGNEIMYILGVLTIDFDKFDEDKINEETIAYSSLNLVDDIMNLYAKNPNIFI